MDLCEFEQNGVRLKGAKEYFKWVASIGQVHWYRRMKSEIKGKLREKYFLIS